MHFQKEDIDYILSTAAIREKTQKIFNQAQAGKTHFQVHLSQLESVSDYVLSVIQEKYPQLDIPFHSRHGHLNAGANRIGELNSFLSKRTKLEIAKSQIDLVVVSVLLDAGAGDRWQYFEESTKTTFSRSEGLAVASYHMFCSGAFSGDPSFPWQADAKGLKKITPDILKSQFQVSDQNPLVGVGGRVQLLNQLAKVMSEQHPEIFKNGRISDMLDHLVNLHGTKIKATQVLDFVLRYFGNIWPSRIRLGNQNLGDVWSYSQLGSSDSIDSLVPFHKLSQWLSYSLLVPMIDMGLEIMGVDELTGLAEYRNGGLMLDSGLLQARDPKILEGEHATSSDVVIEWRALTVVLLDLIAEQIRRKLNKTKEELPLAKVLEGGTWHAGRKIAKEKRSSGGPPLKIISDGTVF